MGTTKLVSGTSPLGRPMLVGRHFLLGNYSCFRAHSRMLDLTQLGIRNIANAWPGTDVVENLLQLRPAVQLFGLPGMPQQMPGASVLKNPVKHGLSECHPILRASELL